MSRTIFPVTKDVAKMMQPMMGCKPDEKDVDVLAAAGGPSDPKKGVVPEAGSLEFNTEGGVPYLQSRYNKTEACTRLFFRD